MAVVARVVFPLYLVCGGVITFVQMPMYARVAVWVLGAVAAYLLQLQLQPWLWLASRRFDKHLRENPPILLGHMPSSTRPDGEPQ